MAGKEPWLEVSVKSLLVAGESRCMLEVSEGYLFAVDEALVLVVSKRVFVCGQ